MTDNEIRKENERKKRLMNGARKLNLPSHARGTRSRAFSSFATARCKPSR